MPFRVADSLVQWQLIVFLSFSLIHVVFDSLCWSIAGCWGSMSPAAYESLKQILVCSVSLVKDGPSFSGKPVVEGVFWQLVPSGSQRSPHPRVAPHSEAGISLHTTQ